MINKTIINTFKILILKLELDLLKDKNNKQLYYKIQALKRGLKIILKYPKKLTLMSMYELSNFPNIGHGIMSRIEEIIKTKTLEELKNFKISHYIKLINNLTTVYGIGYSTAVNLIHKGIKSISDLKNKISTNKIKVGHNIKIGILYYKKFYTRIPRDEIDNIKIIFDDIILNMNKQYNINYILTICGSYRREKEYCNDIDVLLTCSNNRTNEHLYIFIEILKQPHKLNNQKSLIIEDITLNYKNKYMGFIRYKNNLVRKIDIIYQPYIYYYSSLLYFTGSADFNLKMRKRAKEFGYKLSEYGLKDLRTGNTFKIFSEQDIFKLLNLKYIEPKNR